MGSPKKSAAEDSDENQTYEVEAILGHRKKGKKIEFKIKWKGYGLDECTWQQERDLGGSAETLLVYKSKHPATFPKVSLKRTPKRGGAAKARTEKKKKVDKKRAEEDEDKDSYYASEKSDDDTTEATEETKEDSDEEPLDDDEDSEDGENQYEIEKIVSHRVLKGQTWYTVAWKGHPGDDSECLEEDLAGAPDLLADYKKEHMKKTSEKKAKTPSKEKKTTPPPESARKKRKSPSPSPGPSTKRARRSLNNERSETPDSIVLPSSPRKRPAVDATPKKETPRKASPEKESPKKAKKNATPPPSPSKKKSPVKDSSPDKTNDISPPQSPTRRMPRRSCTSQPEDEEAEKQLGITNGLHIEGFGHFLIKNNLCTIKVTYRDPIPTGFKKSEVVPTRLVRGSSRDHREMLFDYYEAMLSQ